MGIFGKKEEHHEYDPMIKILEGIRDGLETKAEIRGKQVFCPKWNITIIPHISELTDRSAVLEFNIVHPDWDEPLFECCAGMGKDTDTAIGMSLGSFLFAFMQGIAVMQRQEDFLPLESKFAGHTHRWRVFKSNMVGMGESVDNGQDNYGNYWELLKDEIAKRLGNQRLTYVKIYAAKSIGPDGAHVTGECRINDVASEELGAMVAKVAEKWDIKQFSSQKLFFFIQQEPQTLLPYPYSDRMKTLSEAVIKSIELFCAVSSDEDYDELFPKMQNALGDSTLAQECFSFLPEICAERAFCDLKISESFSICKGSEKVVCYKNQLADFFPLGNTLFDLFERGIYGDQTDTIYRKLISLSAICSMAQQLREKGSNPADCKPVAMAYSVCEDFEIR